MMETWPPFAISKASTRGGRPIKYAGRRVARVGLEVGRLVHDDPFVGLSDDVEVAVYEERRFHHEK